MKVKTVPGLYGSGSDHWQTLWESKYGFERIEQDNWERPDYESWEKNLINALKKETEDEVVLVAHSLGCLLIAKAMPKIKQYIKAVFFVAPPDPTGLIFPDYLRDFKSIPDKSLDIQGIIVYSENDHYAAPGFPKTKAKEWGFQSISIGKKGHINSESEIGYWDDGYHIFKKLLYKSEYKTA